MNLYEIKMRHYAPRDSQEGILCYLAADSNEEVYDWIKSEPKIDKDINIYVPWMDYDNPEEDDYEEGFRERIITCSGDMYDDESEVDDLYYGATQYGWNLINENISSKSIDLIRACGIKVFNK